jgi:N6-adenosine-specific RNA methylase IME4
MNKYHVIYADPPWETKAGRELKGYTFLNGKQTFAAGSNVARDLSYPTMTLEEIKALPVKSIAHADAHLYLWVTNQYLLEAKEVIKQWGFKYSTSIIWSKNPMGGGLGGAFGISHEILLFCRRGTLRTKCRIKGTVHHVKRPYVNGKPVHSKKPEYFAELIEKVSPGPYVELFARATRTGWDIWGNELQNDVQMEIPA